MVVLAISDNFSPLSLSQLILGIGKPKIGRDSFASFDDVVSDLGASVQNWGDPVDAELGSHNTSNIDWALWLVMIEQLN